MSGQTHKFTGYIVNTRGDIDDKYITEIGFLDGFATNRSDAWDKFLKLVGGDYKTWKSRGYVTEKVEVFVAVVPN